MATIDESGVTPVDLQGYKEILENTFREEFGESLSVDPETPAGQIISVAALMLAEADENVVSLGNSMSIAHSVGGQVDDLIGLLHVSRATETYTRVSATLSGVVGTVIPQGSRAKQETTGEEFELISTVTIGADSTIDGNFRAVNPGPVSVPAGQLNSVVTLVSGWETVRNAAGETFLGENSESDVRVKSRYRLITAQNGCATRDALQAAVINAGATRVRIEENDTTSAVTRQGLSIAGPGIMVIALGGDVDSVANAVLQHKPLGVAMSGNQNHSGGATNGIYQRVTRTAVRVALSINVIPGSVFPGDGVDKIRSEMVKYAAGQFVGGLNQFEVDGFQIGETINLERLRVPIFSVPGHSINSLGVKVKGSGDTTTDTDLPGTAPLATLYTLAAEDIAITVTTTG